MGKEHKTSRAHGCFLLQMRLFIQKLAKLTVLCYYYKPKTQGLKWLHRVARAAQIQQVLMLSIRFL